MPGTILLIEDEPTLRRTLSEVLEAANWNVVPAGNLSEALAHLAESGRLPDRILSDIDLARDGRQAGHSFVGAVRALNSAVRCILMSGDHENVALPLVRCHQVPLLLKPFPHTQLLRMLD